MTGVSPVKSYDWVWPLYNVCKGELNNELRSASTGMDINSAVVGGDKAINDVQTAAFDFAGPNLFDLICRDFP